MLAVKENTNFKFKPEVVEQFKQLMGKYPHGQSKSAILAILHEAQEQNNHWLSVEVMDEVARIMNIKPIEVYEVATFYSMFNMKPVGKYVLEICRTSPCCLEGAEWLIDYLKMKLDVSEGETTADGLFTIKPVECLAACGYAPMMQIGNNYYEFLNSEEKVDALLNKLITEAAAKN
jgi:NADH-quinone oxidoreductase subunit E